MFSAIVVLCMLCFFVTAKTDSKLKGNCPPKDANFPCDCWNSADDFTLECSDVDKVDVFMKQTQLNSYKRITLQLRNLRIKRIPENFFGLLHVTNFYIYNSTVESIDSNAFTKQKEYLKFIQIDYSRLNAILNPSLQNLKNLKVYELKYNDASQPLREIKRSDTINLPSGITYIALDHDGIENIEDGAFTRFENLTTLSLAGNKLTLLPQKTLPSTLSAIYISSNLFTEMPVNALLPLKNIVAIIMNDNKVKYFPKESNMKIILDITKFFMIDGNPLECSCDFKWYPSYKTNHIGTVDGKCQGDNNRQSYKLADLTAESFDEC
ncbi:Uncharacterised protein g11175 [Pycnogonum litorale]